MTCVQVGRVAVPRYAVVVFIAATLTLGGAAFTYAVPVALALDVRFVTPAGLTVGLLIGLTLAFLGNAAAMGLAAPRRRVSPRMVDAPAPHVPPVVQTITAHGYLSTEPDIRDDLSITFMYCRDLPYSVLIDISMVDPHDDSISTPTRWEVSRDLLHDAAILGRASGAGDFRASALGQRRVRLRLVESLTYGHYAPPYYDMYLSRGKLRSFLLRTTSSIPIGCESSYLDIDGQLEKMFA